MDRFTDGELWGFTIGLVAGILLGLLSAGLCFLHMWMLHGPPWP